MTSKQSSYHLSLIPTGSYIITFFVLFFSQVKISGAFSLFFYTIYFPLGCDFLYSHLSWHLFPSNLDFDKISKWEKEKQWHGGKLGEYDKETTTVAHSTFL